MYMCSSGSHTIEWKVIVEMFSIHTGVSFLRNLLTLPGELRFCYLLAALVLIWRVHILHFLPGDCCLTDWMFGANRTKLIGVASISMCSRSDCYSCFALTAVVC
jgi:hypothetical protein